MRFRILGPKGHPVIRSASPRRIVRVLPRLVKRFGRVQVVRAPVLAPTLEPREKVVHWARWGVAHEPQIHYAETRPYPHSLALPLTTDCSGFATLCYKTAGAPDPNGLDYNGQGFTGTLVGHGQHVTRPRIGDLVIFGPGSGHHVCVVVTADPDPLLVSHGQERGPLYVRLSEEKAAQPPGVRFRSYLP